MENYMHYHIMGPKSISRIILKPGVLPSKSLSQSRGALKIPYRNLFTEEGTFMQSVNSGQLEHPGLSPYSGPVPAKKQKLESNRAVKLDEFIERRATLVPEVPSTSSGYSRRRLKQSSFDKSTQVNLKKNFRGIGVQVQSKTHSQASSPLKLHTSTASTSTSPCTIKLSPRRRKNTTSSLSSVTNRLYKTDKESDESASQPSVSVIGSSPSIKLENLKQPSDSGSSSVVRVYNMRIAEREDAKRLTECIVKKILRSPRLYIGIPKNLIFLLDIITKQTSIPENHVLMCLKKIRCDTRLVELADDFGISVSYASKIFCKTVPILASFLLPFIIKPDRESIKRNLPMAFRHRYHNVTCIIDCLEIEIQKPSKAVDQAATWSEYKKNKYCQISSVLHS